MDGGLHVTVNSHYNGVGNLKGSIACDIELQNTITNHPCNVKIDNLGSGQGGEEAMKIQDPIEFLIVNVDERQLLKAVDTNARNVVMKDKKQKTWVLTKFLSTQEHVLKEVIHECMTKSSLHQAKLDAQRNGKDNEIGLRRHAPYLVRGKM
jgi:hypothetical protein